MCDKPQVPVQQSTWALGPGQGCSETSSEQEAEDWGLVLPFQVCLCSCLLLVDFMRRNPFDILDLLSWIHRFEQLLLTSPTVLKPVCFQSSLKAKKARVTIFHTETWKELATFLRIKNIQSFHQLSTSKTQVIHLSEQICIQILKYRFLFWKAG